MDAFADGKQVGLVTLSVAAGLLLAPPALTENHQVALVAVDTGRPSAGFSG